MKTKATNYLIFIVSIIFLISCKSSPTDDVQKTIEDYLRRNLKNADTYVPISFSKLDTIERHTEEQLKSIENDTTISDHAKTEFLKLMKAADMVKYSMTHVYEITNSNHEKIKMSINFQFNDSLKIIENEIKSINGEYGMLSGVVYWKYNDFVGNKPDIGSQISLFSLDSIRQGLKYETNVDAQGNYNIKNVLPGYYFLIVRSKNATDCPEKHLSNLTRYADEIKQLFSFDILQYQTQVEEINRIDSLAGAIIRSPSGNPSSLLERYYSTQQESRNKAEILLQSFPSDFKNKIGIYSGYSNSLDLKMIRIEENNSKNVNTDFGITCI